MKTIYLSLREEVGPSIFKAHNVSQWFYFSPDYLSFHLLEKNCLSSESYFDIGELLQDKAYELKSSYIELVGRLGIKFSRKHPLAWWTSLVAERNEMQSHAFLTVCYYNVFLDIYERDGFQDRSLIVIESISLFLLIAKQLRKKCKVVTFGKPYFLTWTFLRPKIAAIYRIVKFVSWMFSGKLKQIPDMASSSGSEKIFIRTWVTEKTISALGELHDAYFPRLYEYLERKGYEVVIIPNFYNLTLSRKEIQRRIVKCKYKFFIPENYLTCKDYFNVFCILIYQALISRLNHVEYNDKDISNILTETQRAGIFFPYTFIAQAFALRHLSGVNIKIKSFIYTFENMYSEKPLSYAVKEYFPGVESIGFQHSVLYPLQICLYPSSQEWKDMPLPDRIVCSGKFFIDIYLKHGSPRERFGLGPALRFSNLISKCEKDQEDSPVKVFKKNRILIVLPLDEPDALELVIKSSEAIKMLTDTGGLRIGMKFHPMMSVLKFDNIVSFFNDIRCDMEIIDEPVDKILSQYSLLITMASGVIFESIVEGLPVIRVGHSNSLNFDPADYIANNSYDFRAQTVGQLNKLISKLLLMGDEERIEVLKFGRKCVKELFSPVNENTLRSFIGIN